MKANPDKCHLLISSKSQSDLKIGNKTNKSSTSERLLGIKIHNKLRLNTHIEDFVSVHTCNQQTFAIEMYKLSRCIAMKIFEGIFSYSSRVNYNLRYQSEFSRPLVKLVFNGTETFSYSGLRVWDLVLLQMKQKESLTVFKEAIKT